MRLRRCIQGRVRPRIRRSGTVEPSADTFVSVSLNNGPDLFAWVVVRDHDDLDTCLQFRVRPPLGGAGSEVSSSGDQPRWSATML